MDETEQCLQIMRQVAKMMGNCSMDGVRSDPKDVMKEARLMLSNGIAEIGFIQTARKVAKEEIEKAIG